MVNLIGAREKEARAENGKKHKHQHQSTSSSSLVQTPLDSLFLFSPLTVLYYWKY